MYEVVEVCPHGDERVAAKGFNTLQAASEHADALQDGEVWFMYHAREAK